MPIFVTLAKGVRLTDELSGRTRQTIRTECSPRYVPDIVFSVADLPRTLTRKVLEIPVKRLLMGGGPQAVARRDSLANPEALGLLLPLAQGHPDHSRAAGDRHLGQVMPTCSTTKMPGSGLGVLRVWAKTAWPWCVRRPQSVRPDCCSPAIAVPHRPCRSCVSRMPLVCCWRSSARSRPEHREPTLLGPT